jgi:FAD/FMN-containing dehydrogenase
MVLPRFAAIRPAAVVPCATPADIAAAVSLARRHRHPLVVRGGGHCFAGRSSTTGVVIDVRPTAGVQVAGDRAVIGAGSRLGEVYDALDAHGRTIPAGCGPTVGIAGLTLHGGLGILGRRHGLTCDSLRAATVVLADGRVVDCDADRDADLFWALRGGGAPGVVTSLTFATVPAPPSTAFRLLFPVGRAAEVLDAWQHALPEMGEEVAASLVIFGSADPALPPVVTVFGAVLGGSAAGGAAIGDLITRVGVRPVSDVRRHGSHRQTKRWLVEADPHDGQPEPEGGFLYPRSEFFRATVPAADLVARLTADRRPGEARELDFSPWGGAYNRVPADTTAFPHRDARFLLKHAATVVPGGPRGDWLDESFAITRRFGTGGVYPNFPEAGLPDQAYYGANTARLHRIRAAYDPGGVFDAQSPASS